LELLGECVELGLPTPCRIQIAHLGEVVEQPMARQRAELELSQLAGHRQCLLADPPALMRVLGVQECRMPPHERCREPACLTESPRHADRFSRQLVGTLRWMREDELLGQARKESHAQDAVSRLQRREGLLEQSDVGIVGLPGSVEPTSRAEHGPG
jgi:hypothetical protein